MTVCRIDTFILAITQSSFRQNYADEFFFKETKLTNQFQKCAVLVILYEVAEIKGVQTKIQLFKNDVSRCAKSQRKIETFVAHNVAKLLKMQKFPSFL